MVRTKLRDRQLPSYSRGEEIFNMVSHIVGGAFSVIALVICILISAMHRNTWGIVCSAVYGCSLIALYTMSGIYHGLKDGLAKRVMQIMDHCTIYFLIVGTYAPFTLCALRPVYPVLAWCIFGVVAGCAVLAITLTAVDLKKYARFSFCCYIGMGWAIVISAKPLIGVIGTRSFLFLLLGGVIYTVGSALYGIGKKKRTFWHCIFHLFVLAGSFFQFIPIAFSVL